jgi:methyl-accepting chemotaxis protein-2 (aspartate sensor receptor)
VRAITRPLGRRWHFAKAISEGDLTGSITPTVKTKRASAACADGDENALLDIVQQVQTGSENISSAAAQIVAGNQDLAARTEEQASSVEQTAASMEQITATVKNTASHTGKRPTSLPMPPRWSKTTAR